MKTTHKFALITCISLVCVALIVLANFGLMLSLLDSFSFSKESIYFEIKEKIEYNLHSGKVFNLSDGFSEFTKVCVLPIERNPEDVIRSYSSNGNRINLYGSLMGWNENNWHIIFMDNLKSVTVSIDTQIFPFYGDGMCGNPAKLTLDKSNGNVVVRER